MADDFDHAAMESRLHARLDRLPAMGHLWGGVGVILSALFTVLTIVYGTLAFGSDRFNGGMAAVPAGCPVTAQPLRAAPASPGFP